MYSSVNSVKRMLANNRTHVPSTSLHHVLKTRNNVGYRDVKYLEMRPLSFFVIIHVSLLNTCNTYPVTRRSADPIEDLKGGLFVLSDFLNTVVSRMYEQNLKFFRSMHAKNLLVQPPFVNDITPDIKVRTLCPLVRNITELGKKLQPILNETAFGAFRAIENGIKLDGCKWVG